MLVLTLRSGDTVNIGKDIKVEVVGVEGKVVTADITAPGAGLTRRQMRWNEVVKIGNDIDIRVARIRCLNIMMGITAPRHVVINH